MSVDMKDTTEVLEAILVKTEPTKGLVVPVGIEKEFEVLPVEVREEVLKIKDSINLSESTAITSYGSECQRNISDLSEKILSNVKTKDVGEVGNLLTELVKTIQETDVKSLSGETNFFMKIFQKIKDPIENFRIKNEDLSENIKKVSVDLQSQKEDLLNSVGVLDEIYETSKMYFQDLQKHIMAGRIKVQEESSNVLLLETTAKQSGAMEDVQAYEDHKRTINRFEKRLHDMELTKNVIQMQAPQIRQMQSNNIMLAEEIQNSIVNAIPAWQQSIVMAIEGYKANKAMKLQIGLRSVLNKSLENTSTMLKDTTIEVAKMNSKGLIDISTLEHMQKELIEGVTKVKQIALETSARSREETQKLMTLEDNYKKKLLSA